MTAWRALFPRETTKDRLVYSAATIPLKNKDSDRLIVVSAAATEITIRMTIFRTLFPNLFLYPIILPIIVKIEEGGWIAHKTMEVWKDGGIL